MARIGVLGFLHETNTFAPDVTGLDRFEEADAWPGLTEGDAIIEATRDMNLAVSGFIAAMRAAGHEIVPLLWCSANPSGPVADAAFEAIAARIETRLRGQALDGLFLDLHGSMVTQSLDDAEGELLRRLRGVTGPALPTLSRPYKWPSSSTGVCHSLRSTLCGPCDVQTSDTWNTEPSGFNVNSALPWFSPEEISTLPSTATGVAMLQSNSVSYG